MQHLQAQWQQAGSSSSSSDLSCVKDIHSNSSRINNTSSHNRTLDNSNSIHCHNLVQAAPLVLIAVPAPLTHVQDLDYMLHAQTRTLCHHRQQMTMHHASLVEL